MPNLLHFLPDLDVLRYKPNFYEIHPLWTADKSEEDLSISFFKGH
jgi:hypothetical protein